MDILHRLEDFNKGQAEICPSKPRFGLFHAPYAIEADLTLLDAAAVAAEYVEKYGEPEIEEAAEE